MDDINNEKIGGFKGFLISHRLTRPLFSLVSNIRHYGVRATVRILLRRFGFVGKSEFSIKKIYHISGKRRKTEQQTVFDRNIKISILVPLYNTPEKFLREMIASVEAQTYRNFELCLADGSTQDFSYVGDVCKSLAAQDKRIRYKKLEKNLGISENTNACIDLSTGEYIGLFDHDDLLHPSALFRVMEAICGENADFIYTDENTFAKTPEQKLCPNFKPDFSPDTLRSYNYICHFTVFSRELLHKVGNFNSEYDGSQDYDLILRMTEQAKKIVHIPEILYFWRSHAASTASAISAKPYIVNAAHKAISAHLERVGLEGTVTDAAVPSTYKIEYKIKGTPLISILIPNKDHTDDLEKCLSSLYSKSTYQNFEVIVIENNSTDPATFSYYDTLKKYDNLQLVHWHEDFNFSAINNFGARHAKGEYLLLLNNDVEILSPHWLEEMLMFAQRRDVGAVGAKLYYPDDTIQHAGVVLGIGGIAGHAHKYLERSAYGYMTRACIAQNMSACTAACLLIRRDVFDQLGGLDETFKVAFNDIDFCLQIRKAGYLIVFTPFAELYHYESKSRGAETTPEKIERFNSEITHFKEKWGDALKAGDPYYNPNLSIEFEDFRFR